MAQDDVDEEIARQQKVVERFVAVLEKNPRKGTALDKLYGFHVENGTLEAFVKGYEARAAEKPNDGAAWMILGMLESQRGRDAAAVAAFTKAAEAMPENALPAYYLGQSYVLVGQPEEAVKAFESAIARKPVQTDLLEVFQSLARVHQRAQRTAEALQTWTRLEKLFPNDPRVQEQIAATLVEEGQHAEALPRYEALIKITKDDYRKSVYRIESAEIKVRLNRSAEAIADLEQLLASLNPTSWLHREVRRKIEEVFLRTDDQDGLAKYYEGWVKRNPEDVDAMARLARVLARQARVPEAQEWLDKALKLAPSRKELRLAFIEQLVDDQRYADAIGQYELLDQADPNNPDYLREWGKLVLRDTARPKEERREQAEAVWRRLLAARPKDPLIATQVADLFRHAEMSEPALELYQKAVELAPDQPQYREYLGEFYHQLKRSDDALATWRKIAEGKNRTAGNLARLAEVFASFGYLAEAIPEIEAACKLDPKDFALQLKAADLFTKADRFADALTALTRAEQLAQNDEELEGVLAAQLKVYQLEDSLAKRAIALADDIKQREPKPRELFLLARYREAMREYPEATQAIQAALKLEPKSIPSLATAARIYEKSGDLKTAADLNRQLATADRRGRSDYLRHVAELEMQLGRVDEAIQAGRDLIASAPGNTENYEFFAGLCFRLGKGDEGLQALRRAMRVNPGEPQLVLTLASALSEQFRTDEAIELYWQAFDKAASIDDKLSTVEKLAGLYLQSNRLDALLDRLERQRRDADDKRESTICLAQAYHSAGDFGMARQELESLLSETTRDTQLLQQLSKLAEAERDFIAAVKYQEQLAKIAPGPETEYRLAALLSQNGAVQESAAILLRLTTREEDPEKLLRNIDSLINTNQHETALLVLEAKLREQPKNWELLYRQGAALAKKKQPEEAARVFEAILALPNGDEEPGIVEKNRLAKAAKSKTSSTVASSRAYAQQQLARIDYSYQIRNAIGLMSQDYYGGQMRTMWSPTSFAQARMAAIGWLYKFALDDKKADDILARFKQPAEEEKASPRQLWDHIFLAAMTGALENIQSRDELQPMARRLAAADDLAGQYLYLTTLAYRSPQYRGLQEGAADTTPPLPDAELELMLQSYESLRNWVKREGDAMSVGYLGTYVLGELKRAKRPDQEKKLFQELVADADKPEQLMYAISLLAQRDELDSTLAMFDKWAALNLRDERNTTQGYPQQVAYGMSQLIGARGPMKGHADVLAILDRYLDFNQARSSRARLKTQGRSSTRTTSTQYRTNYTIWYGKQARGVNSSFPLPGDYYDAWSLMVLRNALEVFSRNDVLSDLVRHLEQRLARAAEADKVYQHLAIAYVHAWNEDKNAALEQLAQASALAPNDWQLRLDVARFHVESQQFDEALALLDSIAPLNQDTLRNRETLALNVAVRLGDHERARQAAERLFGLRLDADTQIQLAGQMRRLGMHEHADAVLARAQRQAGSRLGALVTLMSSHQSEGRPEIATQIAYQILRRSRMPSSAAGRGGPFSSGGSGDESYRKSALQVLATSGKLKEMIATAEQQLARTPQATQLNDALAELYEAAGDNEKALALQQKMIDLAGDDMELRYRFAQRLAQAGKHDEACAQYLVVLKAQPRLMQQNYYQVNQTFRQANKQAELIKLFEEIDLRQFGQYYYIMDLVRGMLQQPDQRAQVMPLFKRVWEAFPDQRQYLFSYVGTDIASSPDLMQFARQSIVPAPNQVARDPWSSFQSSSTSTGGITNSVFQMVLEDCAKNNQLPALRDEIAAGMEKSPGWKAGPLMIAAIDARSGKIEAARAAIEKALGGTGPDAISYYAGWVLGQVIEKNEPLRDLAARLYEEAIKNDPGHQNDFIFTPAARLLELYIALDRRDDARKLLAQAEKQKQTDYGYDPDYLIERRLSNLVQVAGKYEQLGDELDALRLYREALQGASRPSQRASNREYYVRNAQGQLKVLMDRLGKSPDHRLLQSLLAPRSQSGKPVVDLMVGVQRDPQGNASIDSPLVTLLTTARLSPDSAAALHLHLAGLREKHSGDMNVGIAAALLALRGDDAGRKQAALADLMELVQGTPLEELSQGQRPNARQREAALGQIGLWLVAMSAAKEFPKEAEQLASRAIDAARRQTDRDYVVAMLTERARAALAAGDKAAAEKHLSELLQIAVERPQAKKPVGVPPSGGAEGRPAKAGTPTQPLIAPITTTQFKLAMLVAQLAAENDMPDLAARAIRESLAGGLPVPETANVVGDNPFGGRVIRQGVMLADQDPFGDNDEITRTVSTELAKLSQTWRSKNHPPQIMYEALRGIVFPAARPGEILLYTQRVSQWSKPRSLGLELVRWAVAAGQAEALRGELESRRKQPAAAMPAALLQIALAIELKDWDAAREPLEAIASRVKNDSKNMTLVIAAQAGAIAFIREPLREQALPVMQTVVTSSELQNTIGVVDDFLSQLARYYVAQGQTDRVASMYDAYLKSRQAFYARYSGDYGIYQQRRELAQVAGEVARSGDVKLTLDYLGRFYDVPLPPENYGEISTTVPLYHLAWQLQSLPAAEQYALLKEWTLPTEKRRSLRFIAAFSPGQQLPESFLPPAAKQWGPAPGIGALSTVALLVKAAAEAKQLDDLQAAVDPLVQEKLAHAATLSVLTAMVRRDPAAPKKLEALVDASIARFKNPTPPQSPTPGAPARPRTAVEPPWDDFLLLELALAVPTTREIGRKFGPLLLQENRKRQQGAHVPHVVRLIAWDALRDLAPQDREKLLVPGLAHWSPASGPETTATNAPPAWWTAHGDTVTHLCGFEYDSLYFNYPLTGTFEFSFEAHSYDFSQSQVAYGGLISIPEFWTKRVQVMPVSMHETVTRGSAVDARDWWNRYSVKVTPEAIRFYSNGHLVYEEPDPSPTAPWLHLVSLDHRRTTMRNLQLTGEPVIPREVPLVHGDRIDGWRARFYEKLPQRLTPREPAKKPRPNEYVQPPDERPNVWYAEQGVLYSGIDPNVAGESQSHLYYHRPLRSGETVSYEFFYEPGKTHTHPALGRLVFLLDPAGVRVHWSTNANDPVFVAADNVIDEPDHRRGPETLPLKAGEWNQVVLSLEGNTAQLKLNGELVFERPMEPTNDLRFGLFHWRDQTAVQARNIKLSGNWPASVVAGLSKDVVAGLPTEPRAARSGDRPKPETLSNLLELASADESLALSRARHALTREEELAGDAYRVWLTSRSLPAKERYVYLREWVLPSASHPTFRLQAEFTPVDPPLPAAREAIAAVKIERGHVGGEMVSPAIELVRTAAELKKLDELEVEIRPLVKNAPEGTRNLLALQTLIAVARGDENAAAASLQLLHGQLKGLDPATKVVDRYPEMVAVLATLVGVPPSGGERGPARAGTPTVGASPSGGKGGPAKAGTPTPVLTLAELLVADQQAHGQGADWERKVRWLRASARWLNDPPTAKLAMRQPPKSTQWTAVSHPTAEQRGRGLPAAAWHIEKGKASFHTGHGDDAIYFQSPLRGNFEVACRRTTYGWKEIRMQYAAIVMDIHHTGQAVWRIPLARGGTTQLPLPSKIEKWGEKVDYRLVVQEGQYTVEINGKHAHSERIDPSADPWLAIRTHGPHFNGSVENLQILGSPVVPEAIDITAAPGLSPWRADYCGDSIDAAESLWVRQKDEIVGNLHEYAPGSMRQSVLHYHRPLLEDGEIEYEFFYEAGKMEVHPALDRAALMLSPDGVKVHYLTDGAYDRSGIDPQNETPLAGSSTTVPLKNKDWNKLKLKQVGDVATISVNGEQVGQLTLEPTNQRLFGLFRYSDATGCRVRNVTYRGDWPRKVPSVAEQELAMP